MKAALDRGDISALYDLQVAHVDRETRDRLEVLALHHGTDVLTELKRAVEHWYQETYGTAIQSAEKGG